uniref:SusC/RagA family TonB-linked outer membrane protein n=1 Tax=Pedobacter schmidteae TaxID=2201271 RepID=UPI000EB16749|nr:TonB-dependent receptor [Pedobacter schmidteae]
MRKSLLILCSLLVCLSAYAQNQLRVTGTVTSSKDRSPVISSITIKGTSKGVSSGVNGAYVLENVPKDATLIFSSLGFQKLEVPVNGRQVINITLESDDQALDEVMVVAYGTAKKSTYTGAASALKPNKDVPVISFENAMIGRVPGVQVTTASGQAGAVPSIRVRGIGSMIASKEPLYVIDGVPSISGNAGINQDPLYASNNVMSSLNPADIESITILKDAAASSLYGSRAANGVVVVTTKRGKLGKPVINLKSSVGLTPSWATDNYEPAGIQEQTNMLYRVFHDLNTSALKTDAVANADALNRLKTRFNRHGYTFSTNGTGLAENVIITGLTDGIENRDGRYFDWEKALFRTAVYQTNDLSVSGGDANTTYYTSLSYTKDQSRIKVNNFDRLSGRINLAQKVGKYVELISNVNVARNKQSGFNDTRNTSTNYFMQSRNLLWGFYWPTDYKTGLPYTARYGSLAQNAVYYNNEWENSSINRRITANETLTIKVLPELNLKSILSYDNAQIKEHTYFSALHFSATTTKGSVEEITTNINKLVSSTTLNYDKQFGLHSLGLLGGFEVEKNEIDYMRATGTDLPSAQLHTVATAGATSSSAFNTANSLVSLLSRAEYNYNGKYYASASFRRDGSSKLAPEIRWGNFWSVAGSWRIKNEAFMANVDYISNLRLRASYGINATLPPGDFAWRQQIAYGTKYMNLPGGGKNNVTTPIKWETNYNTNLALEFGLLNNRITGTVEYFNRDSKDLLQDVPISMATGFSTAVINIGQMNNRGFEIELGGDIISKEGLRWGASINATFIKSKVVKLAGGKDIIWYDPTGGAAAGEDRRAQFIYREGQPTLSLYGYEWAGVHKETGKNVWYMNSGATGDLVYNGRQATYDFNKASYGIIGDATPDVYGGINTDVTYKNFTLALNFNYKLGGKLYDGAFKDVADDGYYWERIRAQEVYDNMWTPQNTDGTLPKLSGNDLTDPQQYSTRQMHNASFLRLKNVTLAYNLPKTLINKIGVSNTRVYVNGSNLLTFSKYKIADPEVNQYGTRGWETPYGKTYTFGIEFSF